MVQKWNVTIPELTGNEPRQVLDVVATAPLLNQVHGINVSGVYVQIEGTKGLVGRVDTQAGSTPGFRP